MVVLAGKTIRRGLNVLKNKTFSTDYRNLETYQNVLDIIYPHQALATRSCALT